MGRLRAFIRRHWPSLRLRTILLSVLLFVAAMPVAGAVFLRVYENTLVRQTEAELVAQSAALASAAAALWPGAAPEPLRDTPYEPGFYQPEPADIDLSRDPVLPERPAGRPLDQDAPPPDPEAVADAAAMAPILARASRTTLAAYALVDRNGRVIQGYGEGASLKDLPEVQAALRGRPDTVLRRNGAYRPKHSFEWLSRASALRIHHARPIVVNGQVQAVLIASRSPRSLFRGVYQDRVKLLLGVGVIIAGLIVLSGLVSRGVTRPILALSAASRRVAAGEGDVPQTPVTAAIEIRELYEDFRAMADAIAVRSRYLRDFAAAVSHEFKTSLAGIAGAAELLQDHGEGMTPAERRRFLDNIAADTARLSQLVSRLMDLARADMARPEAGAPLDVEPAIRRVADALTAPGFAVTVRLDSHLPAAAVSEGTLETVLSTLVANSRQAGATCAVITATDALAGVVVSVTDDGPGVIAADRERLFEPFFTSHRADGGTGLGLPIARSLLSAGGGTLAFVETATGARFDVTLPVTRA